MSKSRIDRSRVAVAVAGISLAAGAAMAFPGPDVTLLDIQSTSNYGLVGTIRGYAIGSHTCNIGNTNLLWTNNGTPGLAMNMYQLYDGRLQQIGLSWVKTACCAGASSGGCGTCNGAGGSVLGAGCLDVYSAGWNGGQSRLGPRSGINAYTGAFAALPGGSGDAVWRRLQVKQTDLDIATHPGALYFIEGHYVGSDDAVAGNAANNITYKRVTLDGAYNLGLAGAAQGGIPAIRAWRDHGLGVGLIDLSVIVASVTVPGEGQFYYASKPRDLGGGVWRYEFAVFNANSDRSGGSFSIPVAPGIVVSNIGFSAPFYHSGEPYSNAPWISARNTGDVTWSSPQTFAQNANTNALRWGTMYNFWFDAVAAPASVSATLGLFKPGAVASVNFNVTGPSPVGACYANCDGSTAAPILNVIDFQCFNTAFVNGDPYANCDGSTAQPVLNVNDYQCFINKFVVGCP